MKRVKIILAAAAAVILFAGCTEAAASDDSELAAETTTTVTSDDGTAVTTEEPAESQPDGPADDSDQLYDTKPISQAYLTGDETGLDDIQKEILSRAKDIISENITDGMDDYDKELAIHDYIITHATYDTAMLGVFEEHGEHSEDPYGALVEGKCICSGYTTTFKMFMDMLEIPCLSIVATADGGEAHAWNMAEINGHWYYVDVTWDDPMPDREGRPEQHQYFNTSKEEMKYRHEWNSTGYPVMDSMEDSYIAHELVNIHSVEEVAALIDKSFEERKMNFYFIPSDTEGWKLDPLTISPGFVSPSTINEELTAPVSEFKSKHSDYAILWQRREFEGKVIVAGYIVNM